MRALAFALSLALLCPTLAGAQEDEPVTVDEGGLVSTTLVDVPLAEALLQLAEAADVSLVLPATTLEWVDLRVTARLRAVPLPAAFDLLLKVCGVKGRLETAGETKVLLVDLSPQEALALAQLELSHAEVVAHRAELQARLAERELGLRRLQEEEENDDDDDEMNEDGHEHHHGPVQGDDGEWEEEEEEERDEDEGERGEQMDDEEEEEEEEEEEDSSTAPAPDREVASAPRTRRDVFVVPVTVTVVEKADLFANPNAREQAYVLVYKWNPESSSFERAGFTVQAGDEIGAVKKVRGGKEFDFSTGAVLVDTSIEWRRHSIIPDHKRQVQAIRVRFPDGSTEDFTDVDRPAELDAAPR